jgi:hypothetical protein
MQTLYTNGNTRVYRPHKGLFGTAHSGPAWTMAARLLRAAVANALQHAGHRRSVTAERVGGEIVDRINDLNPGALHVLAVVFGMLLRHRGRHDR